LQQTLSDKEKIEALYREMYRAMVNKDRAALERIHDDRFYLLHMTGMRQSKAVYIDSIMNGTLNYYDEQTDSLDITVNGDTATLTGRSKVTAAVFGGGRHTWRLQLTFTLSKISDEWKFTSAAASTY
jgi:ketosteroid isomerase-like protein